MIDAIKHHSPASLNGIGLLCADHRMLRVTICWAVVLSALPLSSAAQMYWTPPDLNSTTLTANTAIYNMQMSLFTADAVRATAAPTNVARSNGTSTRQAGQTASASASRTSPEIPTTLATLGAPKAPKHLAQAYPESSRAEVTRVFEQLLQSYGKIEQQFGIPRYDIAGAVAGFIAGSYMAYHDVEFSDEQFKLLVNQIRKIVGENPDFAKATSGEKQEFYEQMAILGMFMATTQMALKERPNAQTAANLKQAAKGYLEQFLKIDADRVQITSQGLVIR